MLNNERDFVMGFHDRALQVEMLRTQRLSGSNGAAHRRLEGVQEMVHAMGWSVEQQIAGVGGERWFWQSPSLRPQSVRPPAQCVDLSLRAT